MTSIYVKDEKMTVASLCAMINKAEDMTVFKLEDMVLDGSNNDVIELSKAFRGHQYLEEFTLENVSLTDASLTLDQVVAIILVTVPDLTLLKLEKSCVTTSALAAVGYCTSLKRLIVPNSNLNDKDAVKIAEAVAESPGIEEVDMSGNGTWIAWWLIDIGLSSSYVSASNNMLFAPTNINRLL